MSRTALLAAALAAAAAAQAQQTSCSSDEQPAPVALLERFINADCEACWQAEQAPRPRAGELALDWIVPGARGEDAPLSAAASSDALERLQALGRRAPAQLASVRTARQQAAGSLRVAHGPAFNGYVGTSIQSLGGGPGPFTGWLALVETLPAGAEGSPVERNLVRNLLQVPWPAAPGRRFEARPMSIPEGAHPERLRVVGWLQDSRGRIRAISESRCDPQEQRR
ncbi:hypothetical protein PE066_04185 [Ramlibacter tataouinensis]|uniref:hypothetical protein n=1 Tax=Ramlibacter tataouinensis TaxID=94132 RepID=UPI0022F39B62|nr:hypothetical protein [Ramlibacter tataouinensis]WBY02745.1 hypothetical protein PE066_04185 [Ramlibacter tataouinensis]